MLAEDEYGAVTTTEKRLTPKPQVPAKIDEFFEKKFSNLDLNYNKKGPLNYRDRVQLEDRVREAEDTRARYPNKVPLVIERHRSEKYLPDIDKVTQGASAPEYN